MVVLTVSHNEEKIIYFLLLERKEKHPSVEDDAKVSVDDQRGESLSLFLTLFVGYSLHSPDPPRKRVDSHTSIPLSLHIQRTR